MTCCHTVPNNVSPNSTQLHQKLERSDGRDIAGSYFRPRRAAALLHQQQSQRGGNAFAVTPTATTSGAGTRWQSVAGAWLTPTNNQLHHHHHHHHPHAFYHHPAGGQQQMSLSRTWGGSQTLQMAVEADGEFNMAIGRRKKKVYNSAKV